MKYTVWLTMVGLVLCMVLPSGAQEWQPKGVMLTDSSRDETLLWLDRKADLVLDALILIESRDGNLRATYEVKHAVDDHVVLKQPLVTEFLAGSRIYQ